MQCELFKQYKQQPKELVGNVQALSFGHFVSPFLPKAILTNVSKSQWNECKKFATNQPHKYLPPSPSPQTGNAQKDYALFVKALPIIGAVVQYLDVTRQLIVLLFTYRGA